MSKREDDLLLFPSKLFKFFSYFCCCCFGRHSILKQSRQAVKLQILFDIFALCGAASSLHIGSISPFLNSSQGTAVKQADRRNAHQASIVICYQEGLEHTTHPKQMSVKHLACVGQ